ncbi:variable large family protein, partial [Borreliella burgdorferi]|uniref:variable large family protein n=1 Tax=Borreliella burgdorferi TaxID=139 RepID=UPI000D032F73
MKKISSAIIILTFVAFFSCKSNVSEVPENKNSATDVLYQSIIKLGSGFIDVFNAFSGFVADTFFKSDPKKSDVKVYFESLSEKLKSTKEKLSGLSNEKSNVDGSEGTGAKVKNAVESAVKLLESMITAATTAATAGGKAGSDEKIGNVATGAAGAGAKADAENVKEIAGGIKGIVEAAGKDALKGVNGANDDNKNAGKIFATAGGGGANADAAAVADVAKAVGAVDGKQILKAIVEAAGKGDAGTTAANATNPIEAAIGGDNDNGANGFRQAMKKSDQIAAAIVLRGLAKDGKFAAAANEGALKGVNEAGGDNKDAGKIFATGAGGNANAEAVAVVAKAVGAVDGKQILKAIVDSADKGGDGKKANEATNPIEAAIGGANDDGANGFGQAMKKSDQIAAAIVLRGLAKDGKFAAAAAGGNAGDEKIGNVDAGGAHGKKADADNVKEIAGGIKGIVEAAGEDALKGVDGAGGDNENAGKIFATGGGGGANADAAAVAAVAKAVGAVDGKQILKAIVEAAGKGDAGTTAANATNPIDAAIGDANDDGANGFRQAAMKKSDQIAAAIVLRGLAKDGKFAAANNEGAKVKNAVESAVKLLESMITAATAAATAGGKAGSEKIGNVAAAGGAGAKADAANVKEIAGGIKGIVDAAGEDALKGVNEAGGDNENAGKIFATGGGADADAAAVADVAKAVGAVDGKQILKAIVEAAGKGDAGKTAANANNPIEAAIGDDNDDGANGFGQAAMKKSDQIAAAIVLRGLAKDGKFAAAANEGAKVKNAVESAVKLLESMITAATAAATAGGKAGSDEKIGNVATGAAGAGKQANADNVKEIAGGIKGIVEAAGEDALKGVDGAGDNNENAGKIFATGGGGADADAAAVAAVAKAVGAVDGKQILKAIVEAAGKGDDGAAAANATNPIDAAIGGADDNGAGATAGGKAGSDEKIGNVATGAAGAKANADNVKEIAGGIKGIVEAAGEDALKGVNEAGGDNKDAGKIFATTGGAGANANAAAVAVVAKAVGAVDGKQILKAIVEAAGKGDAGKTAANANNPIDAAIGGDNDNAANGFGEAMKKSDQIAAAIVLRGLAKDGKFAAANANEGATAGGKAGSDEKIGNVATGAGKQAAAANVKEIAGGIKGIVEAAGEDALKGVNEAGGDNENAGKIFATGAGANANAEAVAAVAKAVGAVDGKQILKAIVEAAGKGGNGAAANAANNPIDAAIGGDNDDGAGATAGGKAGSEKIGNVAAAGAGKQAAADNVKEIASGIKGIVAAAGEDALKGVNEAGDNNENAGKIFATGGNGADAAAVADVAKAVGAVDGKQILKAIVDSAGKGGDGKKANEANNPIDAAIGDANDAGAGATAGGKAGSDKIGNVADAGAAGKQADAANVKEIAGGIKGIVEAAGEDALKGVNGANDDNKNAGKIFATGAGANANAAAVADVAKAVGAVDGKQILKAIVEAAGKGDAGKTAANANNP